MCHSIFILPNNLAVRTDFQSETVMYSSGEETDDNNVISPTNNLLNKEGMC